MCDNTMLKVLPLDMVYVMTCRLSPILKAVIERFRVTVHASATRGAYHMLMAGFSVIQRRSGCSLNLSTLTVARYAANPAGKLAHFL